MRVVLFDELNHFRSVGGGLFNFLNTVGNNDSVSFLVGTFFVNDGFDFTNDSVDSDHLANEGLFVVGYNDLLNSS